MEQLPEMSTTHQPAPAAERIVLRTIIGTVVLLLLLAGFAVFSMSERILARFAEQNESAEEKVDAIQAAAERAKGEDRPKLTRTEKLQFVQFVDLRDSDSQSPVEEIIGAAEAAIQASCTPSTRFATPGRAVTWTVVPVNTDAVYEYRWHGTDQLTGTAQVITKTYTQSGPKEAWVVISNPDAEHAPVTIQCDHAVSIRVLEDAF
jgi:hypothetical protein